MAHGIDAEGESDLDLTRSDLIRNHGSCHESAGTEAADHLNGDALRKTSGKSGTTGAVDGVGHQHGADTNVAYARRVDVGVGNGLL